MNNIHLVHQLAHRIRDGEMPRGRIKCIEGTTTAGVTVYQFNYTAEAQHSGNMTPTEEACRGLIITSTGDILALPMPKFYNLGEPKCPSLPDEQYQVWAKVDGSLGIFYHDGQQWQCNTRGSFDNEYTAIAKHYWDKSGISKHANPSHTIMCEICMDNDPMPRAAYFPEGIYLLAIRDRRTGVDIDITTWDQHCIETAGLLNATIKEVLNSQSTVEGQEGWVIRFKGGLRVKVKTTWYLRVFRAIQSLTPKHIRELMLEGNDWLSDIPDDLQPEALSIENRISEQLAVLLKSIYAAYSKVAHIESRKNFAVTVLREYPAIASYLFNLRDNKFNERDVLERMELSS